MLSFRRKTTTTTFGGLLVSCCWAIIVATLGGVDGARIGEGSRSDQPGSSNGEERLLLTGGSLAANASQYSYYVQAFDDLRGLRCTGALVAPDVFVTTSAACYFEIAKGDRVLVGSSERNSTAGGQGQWCTVLETKVSGALSLFLYRITPVTLPHIQPVQLNADPTNPTIGQNLTVVGFNDTAQDGDLLMEATVQVADPNVCDSMATDEGDLIVKRRTQFCTDTPLMGPCNGDEGAPIVDANGVLVGLTFSTRAERAVFTGKPTEKCDAAVGRGMYHRVSSFVNWIQRTTCKVTTNVSALPFPCPDLMCPPSKVLYKYPNATLIDGKPEVIPIGTQFRNTTLTLQQHPGPGTTLVANSTTAVTITATNAANETTNCTWYVGVPPLEVFATKSITIAAGKKKRTVALSFPRELYGRVLFVSAKLSTGKIPGRKSFINLQFQETFISTLKPLRPALRLTAVQPSTSKKAFLDDFKLLELDLRDFGVLVTSNITAPRTVNITLYGQSDYSLGVPGFEE